jgi:hypothetical protein
MTKTNPRTMNSSIFHLISFRCSFLPNGLGVIRGAGAARPLRHALPHSTHRISAFEPRQPHQVHALVPLLGR